MFKMLLKSPKMIHPISMPWSFSAPPHIKGKVTLGRTSSHIRNRYTSVCRDCYNCIGKDSQIASRVWYCQSSHYKNETFAISSSTIMQMKHKDINDFHQLKNKITIILKFNIWTILDFFGSCSIIGTIFNIWKM